MKPTTTARLTGLWYLGLGITGMLGFLLIRPAFYVAGDPGATAANLIAKPGLAHLGLVVELGMVVTQALAAASFYRLFRPFDPAAAWSVAAFGVANATVILGSGAAMATALTVAGDATLAPGGDVAATARLLYEISGNLWGAGAVFFGLWLIPMGLAAINSGRMPRLLGWILVGGGIGYVLSAIVRYGFAEAPQSLVGGLTIPATIGEFWMIGYLLFVGLRKVPVGVSGGGPRNPDRAAEPDLVR